MESPKENLKLKNGASNTPPKKKKGVEKHVEFSIYTKLECNCTTIPTELQYRIALLVF
jgi:hypothetical protein